MDVGAQYQRIQHERSHQRRKLDEYFSSRSVKEEILNALPRLNIGECDPRAKARGVYILSLICMASAD